MTKKKKKIRREPWLPVWSPQAQLLGFTVRGDRKLGLTIAGSGSEYYLLAIETGGSVPQEVLDEHAHELVGVYPAMNAAMTAATEYAKNWWRARSKKKHWPRCSCEGIE